jgi:hypothetical protein
MNRPDIVRSAPNRQESAIIFVTLKVSLRDKAVGIASTSYRHSPRKMNEMRVNSVYVPTGQTVFRASDGQNADICSTSRDHTVCIITLSTGIHCHLDQMRFDETRYALNKH